MGVRSTGLVRPGLWAQGNDRQCRSGLKKKTQKTQLTDITVAPL